jgi:hypothetical protein
LRTKEKNLLIYLLLGILVLAVFGVIKLPNYSQTTVPPTGGGGTTPAGTVVVTKPLKIFVQDALGGGPIASATVNVYNMNHVRIDNATTGSDGTATTGNSYTSGTQLILNVSKSSDMNEFVTITVPQMTPADAQAQTTNPVTVGEYVIGTGALTVVNTANGTSLHTGYWMNFTTDSVTQYTVTVTLTNTVDNTGWLTSYDPLDGVNQGLITKIYSSSTGLAVTGDISTVVNRGGVNYFFHPIQDSQFDKQKVGTTYPTYQGTSTFTITINKGSLAAGSSETLTIDIREYFDPAYFNLYGNGGPNDASLTSFTLVMRA